MVTRDVYPSKDPTSDKRRLLSHNPLPPAPPRAPALVPVRPHPHRAPLRKPPHPPHPQRRVPAHPRPERPPRHLPPVLPAQAQPAQHVGPRPREAEGRIAQHVVVGEKRDHLGQARDGVGEPVLFPVRNHGHQAGDEEGEEHEQDGEDGHRREHADLVVQALGGALDVEGHEEAAREDGDEDEDRGQEVDEGDAEVLVADGLGGGLEGEAGGVVDEDGPGREPAFGLAHLGPGGELAVRQLQGLEEEENHLAQQRGDEAIQKVGRRKRVLVGEGVELGLEPFGKPRLGVERHHEQGDEGDEAGHDEINDLRVAHAPRQVRKPTDHLPWDAQILLVVHALFPLLGNLFLLQLHLSSLLMALCLGRRAHPPPDPSRVRILRGCELVFVLPVPNAVVKSSS